MEKTCIRCNKVQLISEYKRDGYITKKCNTCLKTLSNQIGVCEVCSNKRAVYNYPGNKSGIRCFKHKLDKMYNINYMCISCYNKPAYYGAIGDKYSSFCNDCKEPYMVDIKHNMCIKCHVSRASCGIKNGKPVCCVPCKDAHMVDLIHDLCIICLKVQSSFGLRDDGRKTHCKSCKTDIMVHLTSIKETCIVCNIYRAYYRYEKDAKPTHCSTCKDENMIMKDIKCISCGIKKPIYGKKGEQKTHCKGCKDDDMIDVINKMCIKCNTKRATFGITYGNPITCNTCKSENMVDVLNKRCIVCKDTRPCYALEGMKRSHCFKCKTPDMVNVLHYMRCKSDNCNKNGNYALPGMAPQFCYLHKQNGMISKPRKRCSGNDIEECKEMATHGNGRPLHCEYHASDDEYNLAERPCNRCSRYDILNKDGICISYCSPDEKFNYIKKYEKIHENDICKLLKNNIDNLPNVLQTWQDEIIDATCTKRRPDFAYHCGKYIIFIEVDENQHKSYKNCGTTIDEIIKGENRRMFEISQIFQGLPTIWIRYNPHNYRDTLNRCIKVPQKVRNDTLIKWIKQCMSMIWKEGIYVKYLFYNNYEQMDAQFIQISESDVL